MTVIQIAGMAGVALAHVTLTGVMDRLYRASSPYADLLASASWSS